MNLVYLLPNKCSSLCLGSCNKIQTSGNKKVLRFRSNFRFQISSQEINIPKKKMGRPKIYLFGDSLTQQSFGDGGWGASLANHYARTLDMVLRGYSGYNTRWALKVFDKVFEPETEAAQGVRDPVVAVTVFFGANDSCLPDRYAASQHVPIDEYKLNLQTIVSSLKKRWPTTCVILITPPIDEAARLLHPYRDNPLGLLERTYETTRAYADACIAVAGECGIPVVNLWAKMQQSPDWNKAYLSDGLHLTPEGNQFVFKEVFARLQEEGLSLESLPFDLPLFSEIDPADPLKAFEQY